MSYYNICVRHSRIQSILLKCHNNCVKTRNKCRHKIFKFKNCAKKNSNFLKKSRQNKKKILHHMFNFQLKCN